MFWINIPHFSNTINHLIKLNQMFYYNPLYHKNIIPEVDKMKNQIENVKTDVLGGVKWYREKIVEMVSHIENEITLKKIYTFAKTLKDILNEKEGG